jgi:hypothetical protein
MQPWKSCPYSANQPSRLLATLLKAFLLLLLRMGCSVASGTRSSTATEVNSSERKPLLFQQYNTILQ